MRNKDKIKDGINARKDLKLFKIKRKLWLKDLGNGKVDMPLVPFCLSDEERALVCTMLSNLKVPIGYSGNWKCKVCLREFQFKNLKSHDYHILMQGLLPVFLMYCFKNAKPLRESIRQVSLFIKVICSKIVDRSELRIIHGRLVEALYMFEMYFLPSLFITMTHVVIHLAEEALTLGPITYRWMYPFERKYDAYVESFSNPTVRGKTDTRKPDDYIKSLRQQLLDEEMTEFKTLVNGPDRQAISYNAYSINCYIFYTDEAEQNLCTQNSRVAMNAKPHSELVRKIETRRTTMLLTSESLK